MGEIRRIANIENNLIQDDKNRNLYENRETRTERIDPFFFVELHHLHTDSCLIAFMFFLDSLYLWLNELHATLRNEHFLLWYEECQTDNQGNCDNSPTETIAWKYENESSKEIVDRIIEECSKEKSENTSMSDSERDFRAVFCFRLLVGETKTHLGNIRKAFLKLENILF